ncbi:MAG: protein-L-isoaspartate(D-aspartate) O-methyltransferase, partial [Alphaproteobacteria bacterium]
MVERQIAARGVNDQRVLDAMRQVPREAFVAPGFEEFAHEDSPLPIAEGQTISQPYIVALMIEAAEVRPGDRVLEIGAGSGYAAAVLGRIAAQVYTIERHGGLARSAKDRLARLGYRNIEVRCGDGTLGWPEAAPFDAIIVTAGGPEIPEILRNQLTIGGRLVIPIGSLSDEQRLVKVVRDGEHAFHEEDLGAVRFVPLIGEHGWSEELPEESGAPIEAELRPPARSRPPTGLLRQTAERLPDLDDPAFGRLFDRFADARVVLLGEATHGTSEFYRARAA